MKRLTLEQEEIEREFCETYGLEPNQIGFAKDNNEPIFTYEALNVLRLRLTDIQEIAVIPSEINTGDSFVTVQCLVLLSDGRTARSFDSACVGEIMFDGSEITELRQAVNLAQARALRRGIRSVGVNLLNAHRNFLATGQPTPAEPVDQKRIRQRQLKALVAEWGHDDEQYRNFINNLFGVRSSLELNDIQMSQAISTYRAMLNSRNVAKLAA